MPKVREELDIAMSRTIVMRHIKSSFADTFFPRWSEWVSAGITVLLGLVLLTNDDLMARPEIAGYRIMLAVAEQQTWAWILMVAGSCRIVVLFVNGAWRRSPVARALAAGCTALMYFQIVNSFSASAGFAFVAYLGLFVMDFVNIYRAMSDASVVDTAYRVNRKS